MTLFLYVLSGEINIDRNMEKTSTKSCLLSLVGHKYINKRTISGDETQCECENISDTIHSKRNFDRLNFIKFSC